MGPTAVEFRDAVQRLHRAKDAAYRDAWKKRGEVMSIMANIARKVDRLEYVVGGAPTTHDESLLDTVVDLLVYVLKYQTYLADQDPAIAAALFGGRHVSPPYSEGPNGFEALLAQQSLASFDQADGLDVGEATQGVLGTFAELEACFVGVPAPIDRRLHKATELARAAVDLLGALKRTEPTRYGDLLATHLTETD